MDGEEYLNLLKYHEKVLKKINQRSKCIRKNLFENIKRKSVNDYIAQYGVEMGETNNASTKDTINTMLQEYPRVGCSNGESSNDLATTIQPVCNEGNKPI